VDGQVDPDAGRRADRAGPSGPGRHGREHAARGEGFSLQGNAKTIEGKQHPDRDAQFRCISGQVNEQLAAGTR
jgi:hypothetical protein